MDIFQAIKNNDLKTVQSVVESNQDVVKTKDDQGWTPLFESVNQNNVEITKYLLGNGAKSDCVISNAATPLIRAVVHQNEEICQLLLDHNADVNQTFSHSNGAVISPLIVAVCAKAPKIGIGESISLHIACAKNHSSIVRLLIHAGADLEQRANHGKTALALANTSLKRYMIKTKIKQLKRQMRVNRWPWARFVWLGFLKNDAKSCPFARLPAEMIKHICSYVNKKEDLEDIAYWMRKQQKLEKKSNKKSI